MDMFEPVSCIADSCACVAAPPPPPPPLPWLPWLPQLIRLGAGEEEWLRLEPPLPTDNYEGVALFRHRDHTLLALLSDDNQNMFQRSLLLLFAVAPE